MKLISALAATFYSSLVFASVDTVELETVLNSTFTEVVSYHEFLELEDENENPLSYLMIDHDYTDFQSGRLSASLATQTIPLKSNLNEKVALSVNIATDISDHSESQKSFDLEAAVDVQANTLAILKSIAEILGECTMEPIDENTENSIHIANIMCLVQTSVEQAQVVVDLQSGIQSAIDYAKAVYDDGSDSLIGDIFSSLRIETVENDLVLSVSIDSISSLVFSSDESTNPIAGLARLTLAEKSLALEVLGGVIFEASEMPDYVAAVNDIALELLDRDSDTHIGYYEDNLYLIFGLIEAFLIVEDEDGF
jgi:hypothetical protein